jgi:hypothetical protein
VWNSPFWLLLNSLGCTSRRNYKEICEDREYVFGLQSVVNRVQEIKLWNREGIRHDKIDGLLPRTMKLSGCPSAEDSLPLPSCLLLF